MCFLDTSTEASEESDNGGKDGSKDTVSETSKERSEASNQARNDSADKANDEGEDLGEDLEDGVEDRDELRSETSDGDDGLDSGEDLRDEDDNEVEDLVDIRVGNVETSCSGELGDNLSELKVHRLEGRNSLVGPLVLGEVARLDLVGDGAQAAGLGVDVGDTTLENGDELLRVGDGSALVGLRDLVENLLDAGLGDDVLSVVDGAVDLLDIAGSVLTLRDRRGNGRDGEGEDGEESGLHFEFGGWKELEKLVVLGEWCKGVFEL
jgi:hypothetical protein